MLTFIIQYLGNTMLLKLKPKAEEPVILIKIVK